MDQPKPHRPDYAKTLKRFGVGYASLKVDAPPLRRSRHTWVFQDTGNPELARFAEKYRLMEIAQAGGDEWSAIRHLRHWVYMQNARGGHDVSILLGGAGHDTIIAACQAGGKFFCTYFAKLTEAVLQATGWVARHVGVDGDYDRWGQSFHHGVCEVWVNALEKWVLLDAHFDTHYELDGVPLSAYELHRAAAEKRGRDVAICKGPDAKKTDYNGRREPKGGTQPDTYFWRLNPLKNTPFSDAGDWDFSRSLVLTDGAHKGRTWWQNDRVKHSGYADRFIMVTDPDAVYFDVNAIYLEPHDEVQERGIVTFGVGTFTPNLDRFEVSIDRGPWLPQAVHSRLQWPMHAGDNAFAARTVNRLARRGPETRLAAKGVKIIHG